MRCPNCDFDLNKRNAEPKTVLCLARLIDLENGFKAPFYDSVRGEYTLITKYRLEHETRLRFEIIAEKEFNCVNSFINSLGLPHYEKNIHFIIFELEKTVNKPRTSFFRNAIRKEIIEWLKSLASPTKNGDD